MFKNHKNMLERPYMFIGDLESTLLKNNTIKVNKKGEPVNTQIIHEHKPNSCCYYFMCTFDNSRNELKTFEGLNCVKDMIIDMYNKSLDSEIINFDNLKQVISKYNVSDN